MELFAAIRWEISLLKSHILYVYCFSSAWSCSCSCVLWVAGGGGAGLPSQWQSACERTVACVPPAACLGGIF